MNTISIHPSHCDIFGNTFEKHHLSQHVDSPSATRVLYGIQVIKEIVEIKVRIEIVIACDTVFAHKIPHVHQISNSAYAHLILQIRNEKSVDVEFVVLDTVRIGELFVCILPKAKRINVEIYTKTEHIPMVFIEIDLKIRVFGYIHVDTQSGSIEAFQNVFHSEIDKSTDAVVVVIMYRHRCRHSCNLFAMQLKDVAFVGLLNIIPHVFVIP